MRSTDTLDSFSNFLRFIEQQRLTVLNLPASFWNELVRHLAETGTRLPATVRAVIAGSEEMPADGLTRWRELNHSGVRLWNAYGLTETTITATLYEIVDEALDTVPIGRPLPNVTIYVLDRYLRPVPVGVAGELYIGGAGIGRGYSQRPDLTAERFIPDPFIGKPGTRMYRSGDRARYLPTKDLQFLGRSDQQVKVRGFRIELGEIESALRSLPAIAEAVVTVSYSDDASQGKQLVAYVVPEGDVKLHTAEISTALGRCLPDYMVPAHYVSLDVLPVTSTGKIDRAALTQRSPGDLSRDNGHTRPRTSIEDVLAEIFAHVLGIDRVGADESFFRLGGHSLQALRLVSRIRRAFHVELPVRSIFDAPTAKALGAEIARLLQGPATLTYEPLRSGKRDTPAPLSKDQYQIWFLNQKLSNSTFFDMNERLALSGALNISALKQALIEITLRHEALRTTFEVIAGKPAQIIHEPGPFPLNIVDAYGLSENEKDAVVLATIARESARPFDLTRDTALRATLVALAPDEHVVVLTMHHIMWDGWSFKIFGGELKTLYECFAHGKPSPLKDLSVQYADFALWQDRWLNSDGKESQLAYWREKLVDLPRLDFGVADESLPRSFQYSRQALTLPMETVSTLKQLSRNEDVTLFMLLLSAFVVLLHTHSGAKDIGIATQFANRNRPETEDLIGLFANTLMLRIDLTGNPNYRELLHHIRAEAVAGYSNQDLPFDYLIEELARESAVHRSPLAQAVFLFDNQSMDTFQLDDLKVTSFHVEPNDTEIVLTMYDLIVQAEEKADGLDFVFLGNKGVFEGERLATMMTEYMRILERIPFSLDRHLDSLFQVKSNAGHQ
jgi:acyl carrier protein